MIINTSYNYKGICLLSILPLIIKKGIRLYNNQVTLNFHTIQSNSNIQQAFALQLFLRFNTIQTKKGNCLSIITHNSNICNKPTHFEPKIGQKRVKKGKCLSIWVFSAISHYIDKSSFCFNFKPLIPNLWNTETFQTWQPMANHTLQLTNQSITHRY